MGPAGGPGFLAGRPAGDGGALRLFVLIGENHIRLRFQGQAAFGCSENSSLRTFEALEP